MISHHEGTAARIRAAAQQIAEGDTGKASRELLAVNLSAMASGIEREDADTTAISMACGILVGSMIYVQPE